MATLYVRNVPEGLLGLIRNMATDEGRSVNAQVIRMLAEAADARAAHPGVADLIRSARRIRESLGRPKGMPDSVELTRKSRKERNR